VIQKLQQASEAIQKGEFVAYTFPFGVLMLPFFFTFLLS
jgi:hypothetical protein